MRLTYYGYNAFVIDGGGMTILVDPGRDLHWRRLNSLIPPGCWPFADLILVTHGDADHAEYVPQVAEVSGAPIVCGPPLAERWRRQGLRTISLAPGETGEVVGMRVQGLPVQHGGLTLALLGRRFTLKPASVGEGAVGLLFALEGHRLLNLGDTLLLEEVWRGLRPHVLMVPIGGMMTMDVEDALHAVASIEPALAIPVHYDWDILFYHRPADARGFAEGVRAQGRQCVLLDPGESVVV